MLALTTTPGGAQVIDSVPGGSSTDVVAPVNVTPYGALTSPAFWRAVNFISENLASFPRSVRRDGARVSDTNATPHPLDKLLRRRPNGYRNAYVFWRTWFFHATYGNGYIRIERDGQGRAAALHNHQPHDVYPILFTPPGSSSPGQWYMFNQAGGPKIVPAADVLHLQTLSYDGTAGISTVLTHADTIGRAITIDRYVTKYLQKGTNIRGSIEIPGTVPDDRLAAIRAELTRHFFGVDAERDVLLLTDGGKLNNTTLTPRDSQLVQQAAYGTKQIAQITGVPPEYLFELSEAKYNSSVEQAGINVVRYTFRPWIEQAEDELTTKLLTSDEQDQEYTVGINPDALLRGDTQTQTSTVVASVNAGLRTRNEGRALLGLHATSDPADNQLLTLGASAPQTHDAGRVN